MSHLRRYVEDHGVLYPEQLTDALRRQEIYGGSLDTVLLELGSVDARTLADLLEQACGLPPVPVDLLENGLTRPWDAVPERLVGLGWVVPLVTRGDEIWLGAHPDLPDAELGGLFRRVRTAKLFVCPECVVQKIAAERHGSLVPQRHAVLCASYLSALRRRPSVSGLYEMPPELREARKKGTVGREPTQALSIDDIEIEGSPTATAPEPEREPEPEDDGPTRIRMRVEGEAEAIEPDVSSPLTASPREGDELAPAGLEEVEGVAVSLQVASEPRAGRGRSSTWIGPPTPGTPAALDEDEDVSAIELDRHRPRTPDPYRFTSRGTLIAQRHELDPNFELAFDEADVVRRMAGARAVLEASRSRDAAIEALVSAAMVVSPRVGIFRVRAGEVMGLSTPRSHLPDLGGKVISLRKDAPMAEAAEHGRWLGTTEDPELLLAVGEERAVHCLLRRVDVRGKAVVMLYVDRGPRELLPAEVALLDELCAAASTAFEVILKLRQASGAERGSAPAEAGPATSSGPHEEWNIDEALRQAYSDGPRIVPPRVDGGAEPARAEAPLAADRRVTAPLVETHDEPVVHAAASAASSAAAPRFAPPSRPRAVSTPVRAAAADPGESMAGASATIRAPADLSAEGPAPHDLATSTPTSTPTSTQDTAVRAAPVFASRTTQEIAPGLDRNAVADDPEPPAADTEDVPVPRLTVQMSPPPPPLPPPPPSGAEDLDLRPRVPTLHGLPAGDTGIVDLGFDGAFDGGEPMPLRNDESTVIELPDLVGADPPDEAIISLATPIAHTSVRGRIALEDEDWISSGTDLSSDAQGKHVDDLIESMAKGADRLAELRAVGDAAWMRLAARFPGPLEVLRRDLRALPPPAAHGPLLRIAIAVGSEMVPFLLDLFDHPNPDVRFHAAFVFQELRDPRCTRPLAELAFDASGDVRVIAMRVLETYARADTFEPAAAMVRERLGREGRNDQLYAARAVGTLRDTHAVPRLVELLANNDRFIQEAALESLCSITGQQLGLKPHRWRAWWDENSDRHRVEWIIDSLQHKDLPVRRWAADELIRVTGHRIPFSPMGDRRAREVAAQAWTDWWNERGRAWMTGTTVSAIAPAPSEV